MKNSNFSLPPVFVLTYTHSKKFLYIFLTNFLLKSFRMNDQTIYIFFKEQVLSSLCENLMLIVSMGNEQYMVERGVPLQFHFSRFWHISPLDLVTFCPSSSPLPSQSLPCCFLHNVCNVG